jgi:hypothetical protein
MTQRPPTIACEDVPPDQARRMSRGSRMDSERYHTLTQYIPMLDTTGARMPPLERLNLVTMRSRILHLATELSIPITMRKIPRGLLFWRSTDEGLHQPKDVAQRRHTGQRTSRSPPGRCQRA